MSGPSESAIPSYNAIGSVTDGILPQALSPVGRCQTFEAAADGYARGEGCAVALLQVVGTAPPNSTLAIIQVLPGNMRL